MARLTKNAGELTEAEVAKLWGLDVRTFKKYAPKLGLKPVREEVVVHRFFDAAAARGKRPKIAAKEKRRGYRIL